MKAATLFLVLATLGACKPRGADSSLRDIAIDELPARTLYHFGAYRYLRDYQHREGTFRDDEWNSIGSVKDPPGGPFRSGFYVSQHPAYNERYASEDLGKPRKDSPWLMTVTLKDECRTKERVVDFTRETPSPACPIGRFAFRDGADEGCKRQAFDYITAKHGVVRDHWWEGRGFWYVADRSCIEALDSTPQSVLDAAANVPELWNWSPFTGMARDFDAPVGFKAGEVMFAVLVRAYSEADLKDSALLEKITANALKSDMTELSAPLVDLTRTTHACAVAGKTKELKAQFKVFLDKIDEKGLSAAGLSFTEHIDNLHRYGLPKLYSICPGAVAQTPVAEVPPKVQPPAAGESADKARCDALTSRGQVGCEQGSQCGWSYKMNDDRGKCLFSGSRTCSDYDGDSAWCVNTISLKGRFCVYLEDRCQEG